MMAGLPEFKKEICMAPWYFFWPVLAIAIPFWYLVIGVVVGTIFITSIRYIGNRENLPAPTYPVSIGDDILSIGRIARSWGIVVLVLIALAIWGERRDEEEAERDWNKDSV